jgi:hypothetical protein
MVVEGFMGGDKPSRVKVLHVFSVDKQSFNMGSAPKKRQGGSKLMWFV